MDRQLEGLLKEQNGWRRMADSAVRSLGFFPNRPFLHDELCMAAIVVRQADRGDWAISKKVLEYYASCTDNEPRRHPWFAKSWVVLTDPNWEQILVAAPCRETEEVLRNQKPIYGRYGLHWWVGADLKVHDIHRDNNPF
jgi:hypothetical protein